MAHLFGNKSESEAEAATVAAAAAAMAAQFQPFKKSKNDPGCLEGIKYNQRTSAAYPSIAGVGIVVASVAKFDQTFRVDDMKTALMVWKGEEQTEHRRSTGQKLVLSGSWDRLAQEMRDEIAVCSISAQPPDVHSITPVWCPRDLLGRPYLPDVVYDGARPMMLLCSKIHFYILDLDFSAPRSFLAALSRPALAGILHNGSLALHLEFSAAYSHSSCAGGLWAWIAFCLELETKLGGRRIPWQYFADEGDDVLHMELEALVVRALGGVEMMRELRFVVKAMQEAPLLAGV